MGRNMLFFYLPAALLSSTNSLVSLLLYQCIARAMSRISPHTLANASMLPLKILHYTSSRVQSPLVQVDVKVGRKCMKCQDVVFREVGPCLVEKAHKFRSQTRHIMPLTDKLPISSTQLLMSHIVSMNGPHEARLIPRKSQNIATIMAPDPPDLGLGRCIRVVDCEIHCGHVVHFL